MPNIWKQKSLTNGDLELVILPGIGGRLWDVLFQGRSLLFQNRDLEGLIPDPKNLQGFPTRSPQFGFPLWGGEKTWIAPDKNWPDGAPFAVLDSGPYTITGSSAAHITLKSAICPQSRLQIERGIRLIGNAAWSIRHKVTNTGSQNQDVGIWSVMMINRRARIGVAGRLQKATWVFGQPDGFVSTSNKGLICDCSRSGEYKIGIENQSGRMFLRLDHDDGIVWMSCNTKKPTAGDRFAHTHPLEVFNSGDYPYCEAEWHAPLQTLAPNATAVFDQQFAIWTDNTPLKMAETDLELMKCMS